MRGAHAAGREAMNIPIKVDYGVRALIDLAQHSNGGPVRTAEIARRTAIPSQFLAQVLLVLNRRGFIRSIRGPGGGHVFAVDPAEIRLSMVAECLGGLDAIVGCLDDRSCCVHVPTCAQREIWQSVSEAVYNILDSTTVRDLLERTRAIAAARAEPLDVVRV